MNKNIWIFIRSVSIPIAIIFGFKPLFDGHLELIDVVFPLFGVLTILSQVQINKIRRNEKLEEVQRSK
jgi:nicotinamide mononucleotide adenylyltransferase